MKLKNKGLLKNSKKFLSGILATVMILSMLQLAALPVSAFVIPGTESKPWNGTVAESFDGGNGTESSPYRINTAEQLALLAKLVNENRTGYASACYKLTQNIVLNETQSTSSKEWGSIGSETRFFGTFDGNGKYIKGLYGNKK